MKMKCSKIVRFPLVSHKIYFYFQRRCANGLLDGEQSESYEKFLAVLGTRVNLLDFSGYNGGLDVSQGNDLSFDFAVHFFCSLANFLS